jgi:plastocyanin
MATGGESTLVAAGADASALVRAEAVKAAVEFGGFAGAKTIFVASSHPTDSELNAVLKFARGKVKVDRVVQEAIKSGKPLSAAAETYALRNASAADLLKMKRTAGVYRAILSRKGVEAKYLKESLEGLAKLEKANPTDLLLKLVEQHDSAGQSGSIATVGELLLARPVASLRSVQDRLERLANAGKSADTRQLGYAAWIVAEGKGDGAFAAAARSKDSLRGVLAAVKLITSDQVRRALFDNVRPLVSKLPAGLESEISGEETRRVARSGPGINRQEIPAEKLVISGGETLHDLAIAALSSIPGRETEKFNDLARLIRAGRSRTSAIRAISAVPQKHWNHKLVRPLTDHLVAYLSGIPAQHRTDPAAVDAMNLARRLAGRLPPAKASEIQERLSNLDVRAIAIGTVPHRMIYDKEVMAVQAGKPVEFRFSNSDNMPHNFCIVRPGALQEVGLMAEATARDPDAMERQYVPKSDKIVLAGKLLQPGESEALAFEAPTEPGVYPYVCTYPGHWRRMYGALYVVDSLEDYQAKPAE